MHKTVKLCTESKACELGGVVQQLLGGS